MFKKMILSAALVLGVASALPAMASDVEADICVGPLGPETEQFRCHNLFDNQRVTLNEIYKQGYRVVSTQDTRQSLLIFVEKNKK